MCTGRGRAERKIAKARASTSGRSSPRSSVWLKAVSFETQALLVRQLVQVAEAVAELRSWH